MFLAPFGRTLRALALVFAAVSSVAVTGSAMAQTPSRHLAPGFSKLSKDARVVVMPVDVELFSLSAGGVAEPRADWTAAAHGHMKDELAKVTGKLGLNSTALAEADADEFGEQIGLYAAVARSISLHHGGGGSGMWALPTKEGRLDWSFGDSMQGLQAKSGARYGLFVWVRDSYASAERKAAMVALALLGVGISGGIQVGYASLVDLESGRVVWFNQLARGTGDLREAASASETVDVLLRGFPPVE